MRDYFKVEPDFYALLDRHFTPGRAGARIEFITRHHLAMVGDAYAARRVWWTRPASAHYVVSPEGVVGQVVYDRDTAWANANQWANQRTIAIEHSNIAGADYPISDATIIAGARLAAALCLYYKLGRPVFGKNIRDHKEFTSTSCPYHLAKGGKYHQRWMDEAQRFYDELAAGRVNPDGSPKHSERKETQVEKLLPYPRDQVKQDTGYWCGPATVQTITRAATGKLIGEAQLAREMGTHVGGTDHIGLLRNALRQHVPKGAWTVVQMPNDPPTAVQRELLWSHIKRSVDAGFGVAANIVAPPKNYPRPSYKSTQKLAYSGGVVYHYVAFMGYAVDARGGRHVWWADSGFSPHGCWVSLEQTATLIPPKGYCYSNSPTKTATPAKKEEKPVTTLDTVMHSFVKDSTYEAPLAKFIMHIDDATFHTRRDVEQLHNKVEELNTKLDAIFAASDNKEGK